MISYVNNVIISGNYADLCTYLQLYHKIKLNKIMEGESAG